MLVCKSVECSVSHCPCSPSPKDLEKFSVPVHVWKSLRMRARVSPLGLLSKPRGLGGHHSTGSQEAGSPGQVPAVSSPGGRGEGSVWSLTRALVPLLRLRPQHLRRPMPCVGQGVREGFGPQRHSDMAPWLCTFPFGGYCSVVHVKVLPVHTSQGGSGCTQCLRPGHCWSGGRLPVLDVCYPFRFCTLTTWHLC